MSSIRRLLGRPNPCQYQYQFEQRTIHESFSFVSRLVVVFDKYFNLADLSGEVFAASFISSQDGSSFQDVAVSFRIVRNVSVHSFYFYSPSPGLLLNMSHNGTQIPTSNFIRRNMQVDELIEVLQTSGFNSLLVDNSPTAPQTANLSLGIRRNSQSNNSDTSSLQLPNEVASPSCMFACEPTLHQSFFCLYCPPVSFNNGAPVIQLLSEDQDTKCFQRARCRQNICNRGSFTLTNHQHESSK